MHSSGQYTRTRTRTCTPCASHTQPFSLLPSISIYTQEMLDDLMAACDADGNDGIDYNEFIDKLARDTVAPGAMGKRGMQSKDAMGEDAFEMLNEQVCMQSTITRIKKARIHHSLTQHAMRASPPLSLSTAYSSGTRRLRTSICQM